MGERVTIARFYAAHEAHLVQMKLDAHGIPNFVHNAMGAAMIGLSNAAATVSIEIDSDDLERARAVLDAPDPEDSVDPYRDPGALEVHDELAVASKKVDAAWKAEAAIDRTAARAFRGAVLGLFFCPGILHVYTLFHLRGFDNANASARGRRHAKWARALSYFALAMLAFVGWRYRVEEAARQRRIAECAECVQHGGECGVICARE